MVLDCSFKNEFLIVRIARVLELRGCGVAGVCMGTRTEYHAIETPFADIVTFSCMRTIEESTAMA